VLRAVRARRRFARLAGLARSRPARWVLLAAGLLVLVLLPLPSPAPGSAQQQASCQGRGCDAKAASAKPWTVRLPGTWSAGTVTGASGDGGTVPVGGQAYVAVGGGLAVVGTGLDVTGYALAGEAAERERWKLTIGAPIGTAIVSVRAWAQVVTVGLLAADGRSRTEVVIDSLTGAELRRYPAALFGGAVAASVASAVIVGPGAVTSYANATGKVRWRHRTPAGQTWRADGQTLYLTQSPGGYLGSSSVTALRVINLTSGGERMLGSPLGRPFPGSLAIAADGAVLFASADGVTAYSGSTGGVLWTRASAVPEGTDPASRLVYLTQADGALAGVDPLTGEVRTSVPGSATSGSGGVYVVRDGVALGLNGGANGQAWGYGVTAGRVSWTSAVLPWPHFFSDLSGLGGSAAVSAGTVVITACRRLASPGLCADPELVAFTL
jgi:PQQ-like domain